MKIIKYHWTERRTLVVPDECPTDSIESITEWLLDNFELDIRERREYSKHIVFSETEDWFIDKVENVKDAKNQTKKTSGKGS